jgi:ATPase subunit of ABC transporter with duplicated ATPase domains
MQQKGLLKSEKRCLGYVDQAHSEIDPAGVYEVYRWQNDVMVGNRLVNARAYVARFNFTGADQEKKCGCFRRGEKPLHLALTEIRGNVFYSTNQPMILM